MATKRTPSSALRHRTQRSRSYPVGLQIDEDRSETTASEYSDDVTRPAVIRAPILSRSFPAECPSEANRRMPSDTHRRKQSEGKRRSSTGPSVEVREIREVNRKGGVERRSSQHKTTWKEDGEAHYVYNTYKGRKDEDKRARPSVKRRSTTAGEASRTRYERPPRDRELSKLRVEQKQSQRRQPETRTSRHDERLPLRHEKRSVAGNNPRSTKDQAPVKRYILTHGV